MSLLAVVPNWTFSGMKTIQVMCRMHERKNTHTLTLPSFLWPLPLLLAPPPDQTGLAEAADEEPDNQLPARPADPAHPVHDGHQPAGAAPPGGQCRRCSRHRHLHPDTLSGPGTVPAGTGAAEVCAHAHHLLSLLKASPPPNPCLPAPLLAWPPDLRPLPPALVWRDTPDEWGHTQKTMQPVWLTMERVHKWFGRPWGLWQSCSHHRGQDPPSCLLCSSRCDLTRRTGLQTLTGGNQAAFIAISWVDAVQNPGYNYCVIY